jgi:SAM-dependent methyltransferase
MNVYATRKPEFYTPYLDRFVNISSPILDVGAGHGLFLELARSKGIDGYGVDNDPNEVEVCVKKGLNVIQHDLINPMDMYADNFFEGVHFGQVIEHITKPAQLMAISEIYRVLKPGKTLLITSPSRFNEEEWGYQHISLLTISELVSMLRNAGFIDIDTKSINYCMPNKQIPERLLTYIWETYQPDILSQSASAVCKKPSV